MYQHFWLYTWFFYFDFLLLLKNGTLFYAWCKAGHSAAQVTWLFFRPTLLHFHTQRPRCVIGKCASAHLIRPEHVGLKMRFGQARWWLIAILRWQKWTAPHTNKKLPPVKAISHHMYTVFMIREAAFTYFKHFHTGSNVTAANNVAQLSSSSKSCNDKIDRTEETELLLASFRQGFWIYQADGCFIENYFTAWIWTVWPFDMTIHSKSYSSVLNCDIRALRCILLALTFKFMPSWNAAKANSNKASLERQASP